MNRRYIKAVLIGAGIGLAVLAAIAAFHAPYEGAAFLKDFRTFQIPFWDTSSKLTHIRPDLQLTAVFLRFCMLVLQHGFYFLFVPICLLCLLAKLEDFTEPNSTGVVVRRAIKSTGLVLLVLYSLYLCGLVALFFSDELGKLSWETLPLRLLEVFVWIVYSICIGLTVSIFGIAEVIFVVCLAYQFYAAEYRKAEDIIKAGSK